jgi:transcriptional regulator with XRE-family HTH domain
MQAGRALRLLRQRQRKRQADIALVSRCSTTTVSRVELGDWESLAFGRIVAIADALGARLDVTPHWQGAGLDRLLDEGHARLVGLVSNVIDEWGWVTRVEVTYSEFGERGSIDLLAWHAATATLVLFEIKSELGSVEGLLRPLNAKARLASRIAREQFGWRAARVAVVVVFPERVAVRRQVARHQDVLGRELPATSREIRSWLRQPVGAVRGMWFLSHLHGAGVRSNPSAVRRVRAAK